jgi:hypothetical protein
MRCVLQKNSAESKSFRYAIPSPNHISILCMEASSRPESDNIIITIRFCYRLRPSERVSGRTYFAFKTGDSCHSKVCIVPLPLFISSWRTGTRVE